MAKKKVAKVRHRLGVTFDAWIFQWNSGDFDVESVVIRKPAVPLERPGGKWVRVRFVEVE